MAKKEPGERSLLRKGCGIGRLCVVRGRWCGGKELWSGVLDFWRWRPKQLAGVGETRGAVGGVFGSLVRLQSYSTELVLYGYG